MERIQPTRHEGIQREGIDERTHPSQVILPTSRLWHRLATWTAVCKEDEKEQYCTRNPNGAGNGGSPSDM